MKRSIIAAIALAATAALGQQTTAQPAPAGDGQKIVAVVNGETITQQKLNDLYGSMNPLMRVQYDASGGKAAFLDYYVKKRLVVQEALKSGFDKKREVQVAMDAAKDSALFDRYVRDVVAAQVITEDDERKFYDTHQSDYANDAMVKAYHIVLVTAGAQGMSKADAADKIQRIAQQLRDNAADAAKSDPANASKILLSFFKNAARQYSQDGSAPGGGELGWVPRGKMDPVFEAAAFATKPGTISPVVTSAFGYHLIYVEAVKPPGVSPFDEVKGNIRDRLLTERSTDVMTAVTRLTSELRAAGKVSVQTGNIN
jgi:peptidyl-prolyl cis-trans isomerase C